MAVAQTQAAAAAKPNILQTIIDTRWVVLGSRLFLAVFFLLSSYGKLVDIERYSVDAVYNFQVLPMALARPFGLVMPFIELLVALGLLFGVLTRLSGFGAMMMSIAFFIAKAHVMFIQGRQIDCGCFGALISTMASLTIWFDIPMAIMGAIIMLSLNRNWLAFHRFVPKAWTDKLRLVW